jgi:hypothetical protein
VSRQVRRPATPRRGAPSFKTNSRRRIDVPRLLRQPITVPVVLEQCCYLLTGASSSACKPAGAHPHILRPCGTAAANLLTNPALDPFGKIPEFKFCAVRAEKAEIRSAAE